MLEGHPHADVPVMLTEFGGIAFAPGAPGAWGYSVCTSAEAFARQYERLLAAVRNLGLLAGYCYTQFTDTYQEANGLLYFDRTPKFPLDEIAEATRGPRVSRQTQTASEQEKRAERGEPEAAHQPEAP